MRVTLIVALLSACTSTLRGIGQTASHVIEESQEAAARPGLLPPVGVAKLTTEQTLRPHPRVPPNAVNPMHPDQRTRLLSEGFGSVTLAPGLGYQTRTLYAYAPPSSGPHAKRLTRFVHLADIQLLDDESPARMALLDGVGQTASAYRPQEGHGCHIVSAAVRTINALHRQDAFDFVLLGGDNVDNAQHNELEWLFAMFNGGAVDCDSGADDDPVPGPFNDVKDPYETEGLLPLTKWVTGNHDVLVQGNLAATPTMNALATGNEPKLGTRDYTRREAPINDHIAAADQRRQLFDRRTLMQRVRQDKDGHGLGSEQVEKAFYHFDVPNTPLRFVVLDTSHEIGGAEGVLRRSEVERFVKPALEEAKALGKWIILASHHAMASLTRDGGVFGRDPGDAMLPEDWQAFLRNYPVVYSMVGHTHAHQVNAFPETPGRGFFEVMTSSLLDFPGQFRVIEVFDQDNGWLMLRATCVDFSDEGDPLAAEARSLMFMDYASGWGPDTFPKPTDANVELWVEKPW